MTTLAVADVHGCFSTLTEQLKPYLHEGLDVIFLGDLIDRSPEPDGDLNVLELVRLMEAEPQLFGCNSVKVLKGNHEGLFCDAVYHEDYELWEWNGGCVPAIDDLKQHLEWMWSLPSYEVRGDYLFVHAGVRPGIPINKQSEHDLIWIRDPFINADHHGLPYTVVHGHTINPSFEIEEYPGRIAMDCGSFHSGVIGMRTFDC